MQFHPQKYQCFQKSCYRPPTNLREGDVFSYVCLCVCPWRCPMIHWASVYRDTIPSPLDSKHAYPSQSCSWTLDMAPPGLDPASGLVTSGGQHWRPVQTCAFEDPPHPRARYNGGQEDRMHSTGILSCYRPQTKFVKVMFLQVSVCPQGGHAWLLRGACVVALGGMCGCSGGGMHGCSGGGHVWLLLGGHAWLLPGGCAWLLPGGYVWLLGGHAWLLWGACVVALGGRAWLLGGACVVAPGGCAWFFR